MAFLIGALGAVLAVGLFALGAFAGWKAHGRFSRARVDPAPEQELRELKAQQEAFRELQNYSAETAYGIRRDMEGAE